MSSKKAKTISLIIVIDSFLFVAYLAYLCATDESLSYNSPSDYFSNAVGLIMILSPVIVSTIISMIAKKVYWLFSILAFVAFIFIPPYYSMINVSPKSGAFICFCAICFLFSFVSILTKPKTNNSQKAKSSYSGSSSYNHSSSYSSSYSSSSSSDSSSSSSSSYSSGGYSSSYGSSNEERSFTQGGSTGCGIGGSFCGCGSGR